jgi:hypothetical protein
MPLFDPGFSDHSYGFRPGRSVHDAVRAAKAHVAAGRRFVVDMDLEKFFDRVNHDVLMARVARKVADKRVLRLIRRYLQAGLMLGGIETQRTEGTPQGGPLSPLLSNILLDDLDKELERRGYTFCRYADDCNIYVASKRAGERALASVTSFLASRLRLTVNGAKSAVDRPWHRSFLGFSIDRSQGAALARGTEKCGALHRQAEGHAAARTGAFCCQHRQGPRADRARLDRLLPAGRGERRLRGTGRLAEAARARDPVAAVEEATNACRQTDAARPLGGTGMEIGQQRPRPLVECRGQPHERRLPYCHLRQLGLPSRQMEHRRLNRAS